MARPVSTLLATNFRSWLSARGFWLVVVAAFVPFILTGAWVGTHQKDVSITSLTWSPENPAEGEIVTLNATITNSGKFRTGSFNATLSVGRLVGSSLRPDVTKTFLIPGLDAGEGQWVVTNWTARPGVFWVLAQADVNDEISEIEEFNNQKPLPVAGKFKVPAEDEAPQAPGNLTGGPSTGLNADVAVMELRWNASDLNANGNADFEAVITNRGPASLVDANVTLRIGQAFENQLFPVRETALNVSLASGETQTIPLRWEATPVGAYWIEAYANASEVNHDPTPANNHLTRSFTIDSELDPTATPPAPPERLTIKRFYLQILSNLHLRILIPFIGLFYAAGVLSDEKDRGTLGYLLTRPIARWTIPIAKFAAGFLVASVAIVVGILATFALLFGAPEGNIGFLTTPLAITLFSLFAYGSFFILLGVLVDRPYLVGIAWVIGWETIAGNLVPWVKNLTLSHHLLKVTESWPLDQGVRWLPEGTPAVEALRNVALAAVAFLVAACVIMRRREFDV